SEKNIGAWEMRQLPYEHPKLYNPVTGETSWMSGAAFAVRRNVFERIGGFDSRIFMYAEDVDLSWRIRALGYKLQYCPDVVIHHYSYQKKNEVKPVQYTEAIKNNLLLRYRFGSIHDILRGHYLFAQIILFHKEPFKNAKRQLIKKYMQHWKNASFFWKTRIKDKTIGKFLDWDYEINREGAFLKSKAIKNGPKVSVVVRTCQRPSVLRETLVTLRNQTYPDFEVIIVEDGKEISKTMIEQEFSDLNIRYYATNEKQGRSVAGNIGCQMAEGEFINFLDDDDLFFADHLETLVLGISKTKKLAAYAFAFETPIKIIKKDPYLYEVKDYVSRHKEKFNKTKLCHHNYIPIQCIMFSKKLFEELGGFDTTLDYLEDWDLWVRYMQMTDFECVPKTTSIYRIPYEREIQNKRQDELDQALKVVRKKHENYIINMPVSDLVQYGEESKWEIILKKFRFNR
ncbi:MAG: glycosyltransferase, partial [Lachnospiraceae bacterium]|nr:glycosyltransferase [Lachnospiraceae bacterium]